MDLNQDTCAIFSRSQFEGVLRVARERDQTIHLAKDHGCLLGVPPTKEGDEVYTTYAQGMDPNEQDFGEWWERQQAVCGGDDFVENLGQAMIANALEDREVVRFAFVFKKEGDNFTMDLYGLTT